MVGERMWSKSAFRHGPCQDHRQRTASGERQRENPIAMRHFLLSIALIPTYAIAQCPFNATIEPTTLILCPNEQGELATQVYDSYQWYKDGSPIPDQTSQTLTVDQYTDAGYEFSVEVTLEGCTEMSPAVLVDGWVFLPLYVIHCGDEPNEIVGEGEMHFCEGDLLTLTMGMSNPVHVSWYRNGELIEGADGPVLEITTSGSYTCSAAPDICPNSIMHLGVDVVAYFDAPQQPVITPDDGGQLCASPEGNSYQWYLNGMPLAGTNTPCISMGVEGGYTVFVDYGSDCQEPSDPFIVTGVGEHSGGDFVLAPNPAHERLSVHSKGQALPAGPWSIMDASGRVVLSGSFNGTPWIHIASLASGSHMLRFEGTEIRPLRFTKL